MKFEMKLQGRMSPKKTHIPATYTEGVSLEHIYTINTITPHGD